jgi:hypothetical protein
LEYLDDYPTCSSTYATLRIFSGDLSPDKVTTTLGITPTRVQSVTRSGNPLSGWFLSTEGVVQSRDLRRHLDWLLDRLLPVRTKLSDLQTQQGVSMDVFCYWRSAHGQGGPTLNPKQMRNLADLNLEIGMDIY